MPVPTNRRLVNECPPMTSGSSASGSPPPTNVTTSIRSPARKACSPWFALGTTSPFTSTATRHGSDALASFLIPVLNYLLVAAGFFCLFFWAYAKGHFRDIEGPKYRMLELEREYDRMAQEESR